MPRSEWSARSERSERPERATGFTMPIMAGRAGRDLQWCTTTLKILVVLLVPVVLIRFLFLDVWGSLNDAAVPILGLFLLRGEDEYFFACYERMSKIWLFNECCGLQKDVTFVSALTVFVLISIVSGLNDLYLLCLHDPSVTKWPGLVASNAVADFVCTAIAVHMWRVLHGMAEFQKVVSIVEPTAQSQRASRAPSKELEMDSESLLRVSPTKRSDRELRGSSAAIIRHLTVPVPLEDADRSRESSQERSSSNSLRVPLREKRRHHSWMLGKIFTRSPHNEHRSSSQPPVRK